MKEKIMGFYKMKDPSILLESMLTIIEMRTYLPKKMKDCKFVFCSEMKRAMQTALKKNYLLKININKIN